MQTTKETKSKKNTRWRRLLRFFLYACCVLILLVVVFLFALTLPAVQQRLTQTTETFLQEKLGTRVEIGAVRVRFPTTVSMEGFLLEDQQGDTLAQVGNLVVTLGMWKLLNQTVELQDIALENARVFVHTKDSLSNYDFVLRAFASDSLPTAPADTTASPWKLQLDAAVLQLKQVDIRLIDEDAESTTRATIGTAKTTIAKADLDNLYVELDGFALSDSRIEMIQLKKSAVSDKADPAFGLLVKNGDIRQTQFLYSTTEQTVSATLEKTSLDHFLLRSADGLLALQAKGIRIENSTVAYRDPEAAATPGHINGADLELTQIHAVLPEFSFQNDTMTLRADAFSGTDKSGVQVHSLQATAHITPGSIQIENAVADLNQTQLDGDVLLLLNRQGIFDRIQVKLRRAKGIIGDLIALLPPQDNPALSRLRDMPYEVSGTIRGPLENLQTENIRIRAGSGTVAHVTGSIRQLTEPTALGANLTIHQFATTRADLVRWMSVGDMPTDSILALPLPAYLSAFGVVAGDVSNLELTLQGMVGALQTGPTFPPVEGAPLQFEVAGSLSEVLDPDQMGMDLQITRMDAPKRFFALFETPDRQLPDLLQATGTLRGTLAALQADVQGSAQRKGAASQIAFKGLLTNLQTPERLGFDAVLDGTITRQEILGYMPDSVITNVLNLPDRVQINGQAHGTLQDATVSTAVGLGDWGHIRLEGALRDSAYQLTIIARDLAVHQLAVDTALSPLKQLSLHAQIQGEGFQFGESAQVQLDGKVDSLIWDNMVLRDMDFDADVAGKRFTGGFQSPDERFAVRLRATGDFSTALPLLDLDIALNCIDLRALGWEQRPTTLCMRIRSQSEGLSADALTAQVRIEAIDLQYESVHIRPGDLQMNIRLDNRDNNIRLDSDWIEGEIKGYFSLAALSTTTANIVGQYFAVDRTTALPPVGTDSLSVQIRLLDTEVLTTGLLPGLTELAPVQLEGSLVAPRNYFNLAIQAPHIVYLDWDVDSLNIRAYAGDTAALFVLTTPLVKRGEEDFLENAILNGQFLDNVGQVTFKAASDDGIERFGLGLQAILSNTPKETRITLAPLQVIDFKAWTVDPKNQIRIASDGVDIRNFVMAGNGQSIRVEGATSNLADGKTGLDMAVDIERLNFNNFEILTAAVLSELDGWAEAHLKIRGTTEAPQVRGTMQLHQTSFTPVQTDVRYRLSETPLEFTESGVVLDGLILRDPFDKTLKINGKIATTDWTDIQANLTLHANSWQVLNTTRQQNPEYFGQLYVSLDGTVSGPISQPEIRLVLKSAKESTFTYVYDVATQTLQHDGVVYFLPPPRQYVRPAIYDAPATTVFFSLSASIEIDSNLTINSVIDPVTGDDFQGKATGKLQFDQFPNGNRTLAGRVELVRGAYNYSYQSVVKRRFEVTTGSAITWTGDVLTPELDIKARYQFTASPYPLVVNQLTTASAEETARYRKTQTFYLQTSLNGTATQPDVHFEFLYPAAERQENLSAGFGNQQASLVEAALNNINQDKNLLSRQVFGVLLLRNFIGESVTAGNISGGGSSLQSGLTNFLTGQINALADQYLTFIDVDFAATEGAPGAAAGQAEAATHYQLRLQKSFLDDRLTFKLSGGTTVSRDGAEASSGLENASVEYALTPRGDLKVTVFSERGFELLNASSANLRNSGAGLILTKEFGGQKRKR